ncbi:MAG: SRPBCC family protein [Bdellovibrionales bacterium]|nr:SRPBCC family protein [Bdellovibrionales bacterium]
MADVKHYEIFDCTPEQFFDLLVDYESYPDFLNEVKSCKILSAEGEKKKVEYKVSVIKTFSYTNEHEEIRPTEVRWKFLNGDLFKEMHGHWKLSEEKGKTKAEYYVEAQFGRFVPGAMTKTVLSVNLPAMMDAYHKRVKDLYK